MIYAAICQISELELELGHCSTMKFATWYTNGSSSAAETERRGWVKILRLEKFDKNDESYKCRLQRKQKQVTK